MLGIEPSRAALDTNVLLYLEGLRIVDADDRKIVAAAALLERQYVDGVDVRMPAQVVCELHNGLRRKLHLSANEAATRIVRLMRLYPVIATDEKVVLAAFDLAAAHDLQTYDAIILAAAARVGCDVLYSEDMQHGFEWRGVKIVNPFA